MTTTNHLPNLEKNTNILLELTSHWCIKRPQTQSEMPRHTFAINQSEHWACVTSLTPALLIGWTKHLQAEERRKKNERAEWLAPRWRHAVALHTHALPLINRWRHRGSDNDLARFRLRLAQSVNHDTRNRRPSTTLPGRMLKQRLRGFPPPRAGFTARPWTRIGQLALFFTRLVFVILTQDTREHAKQTNNKAPRINKPRYIAPRPTLLMHESWSFSIRSVSIINKPSKEFTPRSILRIN